MTAPHADLCYLDATELARRIRGRELSPVEVTRAHLERIGVVNPTINAIVTPNPRALDEARDAEAALVRGEVRGPLHGVPVTIKDCFDVAGLRTTHLGVPVTIKDCFDVAGLRTTRGSKLFSDRVADTDATAVTRLRAAGAVVLGKTMLPAEEPT